MIIALAISRELTDTKEKINTIEKINEVFIEKEEGKIDFKLSEKTIRRLHLVKCDDKIYYVCVSMYLINIVIGDVCFEGEFYFSKEGFEHLQELIKDM